MRLSELKPGQSAVIIKVLGHGAFRRRIMEMGFVHGKTVSVLLDAPLRDPVKYKVMDYEVSLRLSEASMVEVITEEEALLMAGDRDSGGEVVEHAWHEAAVTSKNVIHVALVGNPNSGKTSLFNAASGRHEHVGNYGGVTVDAKKGAFTHKGYKFVIYDLPGTYALSAYSPEELYVRRHLYDTTPDVVVNVVAASNLERNLYLTTELIDMDCTAVMALNMYDELEQSGARLDYDRLADMLGMPIVPTVSRSGKGIVELFDRVIDVYENRDPQVRHIHITHNREMEKAIEAMERALKSEGSLLEQFSTRYAAIKLLEKDRETERTISSHPLYGEWLDVRDRLAGEVETVLGEDVETTVANDKYGFISGALRETYTPTLNDEVRTTGIIDAIVTHKLFGFPIFLFIMWLMFECTFSLGAYPMEWIESGVAALGDWLGRAMPEGMFKDLLADGILGGVGGVIVFLPNILILYLFISFMEDSGYMARAAFIMDKVMHRMGLHGKSFIPLIMGFGCNVPAIMATRTIESHSSRLITILVNPFISCSARLPVYVLIIGTFFPAHGSAVMLTLYLTGILVAVVTARLFRRFVFREDDTPFVMELPPYRMPTARSTVRHMWDKAAQYLRKMGGIILVASIVVWFLSYFPRYDGAALDGTQITAAASGQSATGERAGQSGAVSVETVSPDGASAEAVASVPGAAGELRKVARGEVVPVRDGASDVGPANGTGMHASGEGDTETSHTIYRFSGEEAAEIAGLIRADDAPGTIGIVRFPAPVTDEGGEIEEYMQQKNSYIGRMGQAIEPVMRPLGFDWRLSVSLISGAAAKEIVVSTLGVLYADHGAPGASLSEKLREPDPVTGQRDMSPLVAFSFLIFVLLYFPCIAALVAIAKETGSWKWAAFSFVYNTLTAWIVAFLVYNIGSLFI
ncbi:MAG: ferrous iron transport protein B [Rikenellaceae bacterium]|nr:ferrous iron transport protein B [Rikenellaceae bacterium]